MVTGVEEVVEVVEEAGVGETMVVGVAEMKEVGVVEMTEVGVVEMMEEEEGEDMVVVVEGGMEEEGEEETGEDLQDKTTFGNQRQVRNVDEYVITTPQTCSLKSYQV